MNLTYANNAITLLLALSFILLGVSFALGANPNTLIATFSFYELDSVLNTNTLGLLSGTAMIMLVVVTLLAHFKLIQPTSAFMLALVVSIVPLLTLLASNRWMTQLGAFLLLVVGRE